MKKSGTTVTKKVVTTSSSSKKGPNSKELTTLTSNQGEIDTNMSSRYRNICIFRSQITAVGHLEKILNEIDGNEKRILRGMFISSEPHLMQYRSTNLELKEAFKSKIRDFLCVTHNSDWRDLEVGLYKQLNQHFLKWDKLFEQFDSQVQNSLKSKRNSYEKELSSFKENIEKVENTDFKQNSEVYKLRVAEEDFQKQNNFMKARGLRAKRENLERKLSETFLLERKFEIDKKIVRLKEKHKKDMALFQQTVFDEHEELVLLKSKDLNEISVKYNKVVRTVLNLHHYENHRSQFLSKTKVDNRSVVVDRQRKTKPKVGERVDLKVTITNKNTLTYLMGQVLEEYAQDSKIGASEDGEQIAQGEIVAGVEDQELKERGMSKADKERYLEMIL